VFLPASDIPSFVGKGNVDLGITGHDVILEAKMQDFVVEELRLGFGKCALQVQVPEAGPIKTVEDLAGKRVVTSFEVLAQQHFDPIDERLGLKGEDKTKIEYVGGSVEAACALGLADGIGAYPPKLWTKLLSGALTLDFFKLISLVSTYCSHYFNNALSILYFRIW
jgi:ATP phosphoribosyltransferase